MVEPSTKSDERILLLVPTAKDATATAHILAKVGLHTQICEDLRDLCRQAHELAGAALLTEEAILSDRTGSLAAFMKNQPQWSDFPLIVLTRAGLDPRTNFSDLRSIGRMTLVQRPIQIASLVSTLEAAIRDRRRQYALRDYLAERDAVEALLRDTDRRKDEFIAMLAHELRNPLAAINTGLMLMEKPTDVEEREAVLQILRRQVAQLNRLTDDLLDVSRVTRGKIELKRQTISAAELVTTALEAVRPIMSNMGHHLTVTSPGDRHTLWLHVDPARIQQVIVNLLTNAAKYTPPGGEVRLSYGRDGERCCLRVMDNGLGIAPEMLTSVFEVFTQVRHTLDRSEGGLGIGLTVVQRLVQMHGGTVEAQSDGEGRGSEFIVCLPLSEPPAPTRTEKPAQAIANAKQRVLVVDDNQDSAWTLSLLMKRAGFQVKLAYDGLSALSAAEGFQPQIGLFDIGLPGMDGYELAAQLRGTEPGKDMLLVAISGYGQPEDLRRSREAGFDHHLVKPMDFSQLMELLGERAGVVS